MPGTIPPKPHAAWARFCIVCIVLCGYMKSAGIMPNYHCKVYFVERSIPQIRMCLSSFVEIFFQDPYTHLSKTKCEHSSATSPDPGSD